MKKYLIASLLTLISLTSNAEVIYIPDGQIAPLAIQTNESIMFIGGYGSVQYYEKNGITNVLNSNNLINGTAISPVVITGPLKLFLNGSFLSYKIITNTPFKTIARQCGEINELDILTNKTLKFFNSLGRTDRLNFDATNQNINLIGGSFDTVYGMEFTGSLKFIVYDRGLWGSINYCLNGCTNVDCNTIGDTNCLSYKLNGNPPQNNELCTNPVPLYKSGMLINYYFTDEFTNLAENNYVKIKPGHNMFFVEKSINLTNWFPVFLHNASQDAYTFYRMGIKKDVNNTFYFPSSYSGGAASPPPTP
jgi:hypothetical protein